MKFKNPTNRTGPDFLIQTLYPIHRIPRKSMHPLSSIVLQLTVDPVVIVSPLCRFSISTMW